MAVKTPTNTDKRDSMGKTINDYKADYAKAKTDDERKAAHAGADAIRGYSTTTTVQNGKYVQTKTPTPTSGGTTQKTSSGSSYTPISDYNDGGLNDPQIAQYKADYERYKAAGDIEKANESHRLAEEYRAKSGYSGGVDGSAYIQTQPREEQQQQSVEKVTSVMTDIAGLKDAARQSGVEGQAMLAAQLEATYQMINQMEAQITGQIQSQMGGNDPGLQSAIAMIKEEVGRQRDDTLEELNARGLVQSGVYAEMLDRINKNELTQVQSVIGSRTADLQNQLNSAIMSIAQMRLGSLNNNQNASMGLFQSTANNMMNVGIAGVNAGLTERGQNLQNQQYYSGLTQNQQQFDKTFQQNAGQFSQQMDFNFKNLAQDAQLTREGFANSRATAGAGNALGWAQLGYQKEQDALARQDALNYNQQQTQLYNQELTGQQIQSMQNSGSLDTVVKQINSGQMTKADAASLLIKQGLTPQAQQYALTYIGQNAQDNVRQPGGTGYMPNPNN